MEKQQIIIEFGKTIRETRLSKDITQEGLAQLAELDRSYMGKIERGEASPSLPIILTIAKALNIKASELIKGLEKSLKL